LNLSRFRNDKDVLTIISPKQQVKQFKLTLCQKLVLKMISKSITIKSFKTERIDLVNETISFIKLLIFEEKEIPK
jgi:hypothetical protein